MTGPAHGRHNGAGGGVYNRFSAALDVFWLLLCVLVILAIMPACTSVSGTSPTGAKYSYNSFGGDATDIDVKPEGFTAASLNNSAAFGKAVDTIKGMWTNYLMAEGLKYIAGKYYDNKGAELSSQQSVKLEELKNAKSAADAEAALKAAQQAAELEAAAAAAGAVPAV